MAFNGRIVRQGNTDRFGVGAPGAFTRALTTVGDNLYVILQAGYVQITDLPNGAGTSVTNFQNNPGGSQVGGAFEWNDDLIITIQGAAKEIRRVHTLSTGATTRVEVITVNLTSCTTDGTTVWAYDNDNKDLYTIAAGSGYGITKFADVTFEDGVTENSVQGMFYWNGRLYLVGGTTDSLFELPPFADNPTTWQAVQVDSTVTSWGVTQGGIAGATAFDGEAYMVGGNPDALYRFINLPVIPDTLTRRVFDEQTAATFDLSDEIDDLESLAFRADYTAPAWLTISGTSLVVANTNPAVNADTDFDVELVATRGADSVDFDQPMRVRNTAAPPPDLMPDFGSETISEIVATRGTAMTSVTLPAATGGDGTLTYSLSPNLPTGMAFNATTRVLSGTPTATLSRTQFTYTVTDADGDTDTIQFYLTVNAPAPPPNTAPAFANTSYSFTDIAIAVGSVVGTVAATDADNDTLSYSLTGTDNSDFAIDADGEITVATALTHGDSYSFNVVANDGTAPTSVPVTVTAVAAPPAPTDAVLTITVSPSTVTAGGIATVTFAYDKAVSDFAATDVTVSAGATKGTLTDAGNNRWTLPVTAPSSGSGTVTVSVGADVVTPGNNAESVQFTYTAPPPLQIRSVPLLSNAPMGVSVELTPTTALITWRSPTNGASVTGYEIRYAEGASPGTTWIPTGSLSTRFFVKGLKRGRQYTWQVRGVTESGSGDASSPLTARTPIASLHNCLFFRQCVNYFGQGARVSEYGNPSNIIRAVADNNYKTSSTVKDYIINIAINGQPTRVDAIFVKGKGITRHSGTPMGGSGSGWTNVDLPATVKNWEGSDVSTTVAGFQHHLLLLDQHFTATSVRVQFEGSGVEVCEMMCLEFGISIDANGDFLDVNPNFVDREGVIQPDPGGGIAYDSPIGNQRDKWEVDFTVRILPNKTLLQTPEEFLYWRSENRNHVFAMEPSRFPWRVFPATFTRQRVPIRYRTDDKTGGEIINFRVAEQ